MIGEFQVRVVAGLVTEMVPPRVPRLSGLNELPVGAGVLEDAAVECQVARAGSKCRRVTDWRSVVAFSTASVAVLLVLVTNRVPPPVTVNP